MKKTLIIAPLVLALIAPFVASAQTVANDCPADLSAASQDQLRVCLISLMTQLVQLEQQLLAMESQTPTPTTTTTSTPATVAPSTEGASVIVPPAQPTATSSAPTPQTGAAAPQQSGYSIQIIAWPGPVNQVSRTFVVAPTSTQTWDQDPTDNSHVNLGAILMDPNGQAVTDAIVTVTSPDPAQNATINGTGNVYGNPAVPYYSYHYLFKTAGDHTITFSAMGAFASITLKAN